MLLGEFCPNCMIGKLEESIIRNQLTCSTCSSYFEETKQVERSVGRVNDPDGNEHKIVFIKVGDYWEVE